MVERLFWFDGVLLGLTEFDWHAGFRAQQVRGTYFMSVAHSIRLWKGGEDFSDAVLALHALRS
jgi:hypothetical protein